MADQKPQKSDLNQLKLETCVATAVADKGPAKGVLTAEGGVSSVGALMPNQINISHETFKSDNGYAGVSARIGPHLNDQPKSLDIEAHVAGSLATVSAPDVTTLDSTRNYSGGSSMVAAQKLASGVMNEVRTCMASPAIPAVKKPFKITP